MGRGKLTMKLISNEKSRKTIFSKRKKSLMRKAYELSTLCDVRACVFVYGPNQNDQSPAEIHTLPPCRDEVNKMIASYKVNCLHKRPRKAFGLIDFLSERKKKIESDMSKLRKDVAEARFLKWDERIDYFLEDQLRVLMVELDSKLEATKRRMEMMMENNNFDERTSEGSNQTLGASIMKKKQAMSSLFEEQSYNAMFGSSSSSSSGITETHAIIPFHYHHHQNHHLQMGSSSSHVTMLQMDHELENLSQYLFGSSSSSTGATQIQFNYGNYCNFQNPNFFYSDPNYGMMNIMDSNNNNTILQNYSMGSHYGVPLAAATQSSIVPFSYMQLTADDQMMMAAATSNSQLGLHNNIVAAASAQLNDHSNFDYFNNEYFI